MLYLSLFSYIYQFYLSLFLFDWFMYLSYILLFLSSHSLILSIFLLSFFLSFCFFLIYYRSFSTLTIYWFFSRFFLSLFCKLYTLFYAICFLRLPFIYFLQNLPVTAYFIMWYTIIFLQKTFLSLNQLSCVFNTNASSHPLPFHFHISPILLQSPSTPSSFCHIGLNLFF